MNMQIVKVPAIVAGAVVVIAVAWWFFAQSSLLDARADTEDAIAEAESDVAALQSEIGLLRGLEEEQEFFEAFDARLGALLPETLSQEPAWDTMRDLEERADVEFLSMSLGDITLVEFDEQPVEFYDGFAAGWVPFNVEVAGDFDEMVALLDVVEADTEQAVVTTGMSLSRADEESSELRGTWDGRVFQRVPVAEGEPEPDDDDGDGGDDGDDDLDVDEEL